MIDVNCPMNCRLIGQCKYNDHADVPADMMVRKFVGC